MVLCPIEMDRAAVEREASGLDMRGPPCDGHLRGAGRRLKQVQLVSVHGKRFLAWMGRNGFDESHIALHDHFVHLGRLASHGNSYSKQLADDMELLLGGA